MRSHFWCYSGMIDPNPIYKFIWVLRAWEKILTKQDITNWNCSMYSSYIYTAFLLFLPILIWIYHALMQNACENIPRFFFTPDDIVAFYPNIWPCFHPSGFTISCHKLPGLWVHEDNSQSWIKMAFSQSSTNFTDKNWILQVDIRCRYLEYLEEGHPASHPWTLS